jgi:hypothetical protein
MKNLFLAAITVAAMTVSGTATESACPTQFGNYKACCSANPTVAGCTSSAGH